MHKAKIAVLFGGCSEEHDVSVKSAMEIAAHIDTEKYEPLYIGITRAGSWLLCETPCQGWKGQNCRPALLLPDKGIHGLLLFEGDHYQVCRIDAVFPVLHGKTGEDGVMQGLLELSGIPYVGCGVQSSAMCMDKSLAYMAAKGAGIAVPAFCVLQNDDIPNAGGLTYPVFVKPARSGSSFGVTKVNSSNQLDTAIAQARQYDSKVLIEQAITGCELGCAVLGSGADLTVGEVDQINVTHGFFRIHQESNPEAGSENAHITVPANLPAQTRAEIQSTAKTIYQALGCRGLARVDLFLQEDGSVVLNEVNTMPGFTSYSRYPRMMAAAGIPRRDVIDRLLTLAMEG